MHIIIFTCSLRNTIMHVNSALCQLLRLFDMFCELRTALARELIQVWGFFVFYLLKRDRYGYIRFFQQLHYCIMLGK